MPPRPEAIEPAPPSRPPMMLMAPGLLSVVVGAGAVGPVELRADELHEGHEGSVWVVDARLILLLLIIESCLISGREALPRVLAHTEQLTLAVDGAADSVLPSVEGRVASGSCALSCGERRLIVGVGVVRRELQALPEGLARVVPRSADC
jgi:hypothetical protein